MSTIEQSIEVNRPIQAVYRQWTQFEEFPRFMEGIQQVVQTGRHLHWEANIAGNEQEWDAEITQYVPEQRIAWRNTSGAQNAGVVKFDRLAEDTTLVTVQIEYEPDGIVENIGDALGMVSTRVHGDLVRFKNLMETGDPEASF